MTPTNSVTTKRTSETLLLDTHVWLWLASGLEDEVSPSCRWLIHEAGRQTALRVSAASAWEAGMLASRGRLDLGMDRAQWLQKMLGWPGIVAVPLDPEVALLSTHLPGNVHRDPADRMLIATALHYGWTLVTRDRRILDYGRAGHVRVLDAGARVMRERRRRMVRARR